MADIKTFYSMHKLMKITELDAFYARKKAGSSGAYFELLDIFKREVPNLLGMMEESCAPRSVKEALAFCHNIDLMERQLLKVGCSPLVLECEQVAELARNEQYDICSRRADTLFAKLNNLCQKIESAKIDHDRLQGMHNARAAQGTYEPNPPNIEAKIPALPKLESLEALSLLVDNFEADSALSMLHTMMKYTYDRQIDDGLHAVYSMLLSFDYDGAFDKLHAILNMLQGGEDETMNTTCKKILAIDDIPDVLNTVKSVLQGDRYAVYGVTNHTAALKFLANNTADLILLDIEMPDMDGFALLSIIRKMAPYKNTPVLFLTGSVSIENVMKSHSFGGNDFIRKPIDASVLMERVKKHLDPG